MKFISPKIHGIIDILFVIFLLISPTLFGFTEPTVKFTYALATIHLLLTLLTVYDVGLFKVIPIQLHGIIESLVGIILIILAYTLFRNDVTGKLFYDLFGTVVLLTWLFSDYRAVNAEG
jgi:hypothetical protein